MTNRCPRCYHKVEHTMPCHIKLGKVPELRKIPRFRFKPNRYSVTICADCFYELKGKERNLEKLI